MYTEQNKELFLLFMYVLFKNFLNIIYVLFKNSLNTIYVCII